MKELVELAEGMGLVVKAMRTSQPLHWHLGKPKCRGTVEVTFDGERWIIEVRRNRRGDWTENAAVELRAALSAD